MIEIYQYSENLKINRFWTQADACASSDLTVEFQADPDSEYSFELYTANGQIIDRKQIISDGKVTKVVFDIQTLDSGPYFLIIISKDGKTSININKL
jgi:predicted secreted protein